MSEVNEELVYQLTKQLVEEMKDLRVSLGRIGKFSPEAVKSAYGIIIEAIRRIEVYTTEVKKLTSAEKKAVATRLINELVDVPIIPEAIESVLIGWSIDLIVYAFNKIGGKSWLDVLFGDSQPVVPTV